MKWRSTGRTDGAWADESVVGAGEMAVGDRIGGWSMSSGGAANRAAVARWAAWSVIVAGPVLGVTALLSAASAVEHVVPRTVSSAAATAAPAGTGPAGFAELYVSAFLTAGPDEVAQFWPGARQAPFEGKPGARQVTQAAAVRTVAVGAGLWSVTVGARVTGHGGPPTATAPSRTTADAGGGSRSGPPAVRYFQVLLAAAGNGSAGPWGFTALGAPAEVAAPQPVTPPQLVYGPAQPASTTDPRARTLHDFLTAYLTGAPGGLERFVSPGVAMAPVTPAPYSSVVVDTIAAAGDGTQGRDPEKVPADGARQHLLASVLATGQDGDRVPLEYAVTLTARAGRWEITSLDLGPLPAQPAANAVPSPATPSAP
ncbi:conjugal transfer protein [Streptomyces sp. NPDC004031]